MQCKMSPQQRTLHSSVQNTHTTHHCYLRLPTNNCPDDNLAMQYCWKQASHTINPRFVLIDLSDTSSDRLSISLSQKNRSRLRNQLMTLIAKTVIGITGGECMISSCIHILRFQTRQDRKSYHILPPHFHSFWNKIVSNLLKWDSPLCKTEWKIGGRTQTVFFSFKIWFIRNYWYSS